MKAKIITTVNDEIATLLIPMNGKQIVLPNVSVAEIIPYEEPNPSEHDVPNWFLGRIRWRGILIPVISFEAINEEPFVSHSRSRRIAVINAVVDADQLPFCGIVTENVPRLMRIQPSDIINDEIETGPAEIAHVITGGEQAVIPNVDFIQQQLIALIEYA